MPLLTRAEVAEMVGVSVTQLERIRADGRMPDPAQERSTPGGRTIRMWERDTIVKWARQYRDDARSASNVRRALVDTLPASPLGNPG